MPTDDIARLDDYTTQTGNPISSSSVDSELDQLVTTMNMKAGRSVDNTFSGANTFSGTVAITGATTLSNVSSLKTNTVSELTATSGVTIDGLIVKDFGITFTDAGEVTISAGAINVWGGYHTVDTQDDAASDDLDSINGASVAGRMLRLQAENDARTVVIKHNTGNIYNPSGGDITLDTAYGIVDLIYSAALSKWIVINTPVSATNKLPKAYLSGKAPIYASAATVTFPSGLKGRSSDDTTDIELAADVTVTLASVWTVLTPGLDAGAEASGTWYYFYLIRRPDTGVTSVIASTVNEAVSGSITLPSNYTQKRQLPFAVRNDGSSNIIPFTVAEGWPYRPKILYNVNVSTYYDGSIQVATTNVLSAGTQTSFTDINCASLIPPISQSGIFCLGWDGGSQFNIRQNGSSHNGIGTSIVTSQAFGFILPCATDSSQIIEYKRFQGTGGGYIDIVGYVVTEVT